MSIELLPALSPARVAWNKGRVNSQKRPLLPRHVWSIRFRVEMATNARDLSPLSLTSRAHNLAICMAKNAYCTNANPATKPASPAPMVRKFCARIRS